MRIRKILLIYSARSVRALLKKNIYSEGSDISIVESESGKDALAQFNKKQFDVVLADSELFDVSISELKDAMASSTKNRATPIILTIDDESNRAVDQLAKQGIKHFIKAPFEPSELLKKINSVCDPRLWRKHNRFYIPNAKVIANIWGNEIVTRLINISMGGVLVDLSTDQPEYLLQNNIKLSLQIPVGDQFLVLEDLTSKLSRLNVTAWSQDYIPQSMRATFVFIDLKEAVESTLEEIIEIAREDKLFADDVEE